MLEVFLAILLLILALKYMFGKPEHSLPGIHGLPLIGYLPSQDRPFGDQVKEFINKYGKIFVWRQGVRNFVFIGDYKLNKEILHNPLSAFRPDFFSFLPMGIRDNKGIGFSNGCVWKNNRRFALRYLKDACHGKSISKVTHNEVQQLLKVYKCKNGQPTSISWELNAAVVNVMWKITANKRFDVEDPQIHQYMETVSATIASWGSPMGLLDIMPWICYVVPKCIRNFITKEDNYHKLVFKVNEYCKKFIDEHKRNFDRNNPRDYIDAFLIEKENQPDNAEEFSDRNLEIIMTDFFEAGSESTATMLRWFILILAKYPKIQEKVQDEIDQKIGREAQPNMEDKKNLPYTEAVIYEISRFASIFPLSIPHISIDDIYLSDHKVPKGSVIISHLATLHSDPELWERPDEIYPEHFLTSDGKFNKPEHFNAFSYGRRSCFGEVLAKNEMFVFLTSFMQKVSFSLPPGEVGDLRPPMDARFINMPRPFKVIISDRD